MARKHPDSGAAGEGGDAAGHEGTAATRPAGDKGAAATGAGGGDGIATIVAIAAGGSREMPNRRACAIPLAEPAATQRHSSRTALPVFPDEGKATSLRAVGARLEGAISRAGYRQLKYLGAGCKGFVIVLDLEHIEPDGRRMGGTRGFAPPSQEADFNLAQYVRRLFYAAPGYYRQIVIVVSEQGMTNATAAPTEAQLRAITRDGASSLPSAFANLAYTPRHAVYALIYEFEKGPRDGDLKVIPPAGRLGATVHLMKAKLF